MIADDMRAVARDGRCGGNARPELQLVSQGLSIATFSVSCQSDLRPQIGEKRVERLCSTH